MCGGSLSAAWLAVKREIDARGEAHAHSENARHGTLSQLVWFGSGSGYSQGRAAPRARQFELEFRTAACASVEQEHM